MKKDKRTPAEKAFTDSDKHMLGDLKLKPWTPSRIIAGQSMGMLYPNIGSDGWDQFERTKMYPGCLKDVIICLWLCASDDDTVENADSAPKDAYKTARKWAQGRKLLDTRSDAFWEAYSVFAGIMREVNDSVTKPRGSETEDDEDDDSPNG